MQSPILWCISVHTHVYRSAMRCWCLGAHWTIYILYTFACVRRLCNGDAVTREKMNSLNCGIVHSTLISFFIYRRHSFHWTSIEANEIIAFRQKIYMKQKTCRQFNTHECAIEKKNNWKATTQVCQHWWLLSCWANRFRARHGQSLPLLWPWRSSYRPWDR